MQGVVRLGFLGYGSGYPVLDGLSEPIPCDRYGEIKNKSVETSHKIGTSTDGSQAPEGEADIEATDTTSVGERDTIVRGIGVVHEDENSLRNRWAFDATLRFRCMDRDSVTVVDVFDMALLVIAFLSGAEDTYESTEISTQIEEGATSTVAARQYGWKGKQPRVKP
ncbi:hypothetical protein Syun_012067 [Stephania yunnanensis]|uniref:Uncharacterized protein n=1 Tax=Stephania yunnanensis TaxID=152371 RepID=A0AAP0K178_9MAGN